MSTLSITIQYSFKLYLKPLDKKDSKWIQMGKEKKINIFLFPDDIIWYVGKPNNPTKRLLELKRIGKITVSKINTQ